LQRKREQRSQTPLAEPSNARPGPGNREAAVEHSRNASRCLQERHGAEDADVASPQGKVFTCKSKNRRGKRYKKDASNEEATSTNATVQAFAMTSYNCATTGLHDKDTHKGRRQ